MSDTINGTCRKCKISDLDCIEGICSACASGEYFCDCGEQVSEYEIDHVGVCKNCR